MTYQSIKGASKNSEFAQMQGAGKFRSAAYGLYVSKKYFTQLSITSHLVAVFWQPSGMAITNDLPSVFCWVSQMASGHISSSISWDEIWIFRGALCKNYLIIPPYKPAWPLSWSR
jgi:hypothetical protein